MCGEFQMTLNVVGMIGVTPSNGKIPVSIIGGGIDVDYLSRFTQAHEESNFDAVLVGYSSDSADSFAVAQAAAAATQKIKFLVAHRPGFVAPTLAARRASTVDIFTGGRIGVHFITGGSDAEQQRDGDYLGHDDRYRRTDEYLTVFRKALTTETFDHSGNYYQVKNASSSVQSTQTPSIPIYFGGSSEIALEIGARQADVYMFWGEPRAAIQSQIEDLNTRAAKYGRTLRYSVSFRPVIEDTEALAWEKAREFLNTVESNVRTSPLRKRTSVGSQRLLDFASKSDLHDERLWMPLAAATGASGNTSALVGTPEQVADSLIKYHKLGVETVLIRGWDPYQDAVDYGKELIPILKHESAKVPELV
jgi:alkanesulfonate monooxygenase